jgi:hypothetical protein
MHKPGAGDFEKIYSRFQSPIAAFDCGRKCAPYNENGVPFCCDLRHAVPTAYKAEWIYLQENTDLWRRLQGDENRDLSDLQEETPAGQVLIACQGHEYCQRSFRSITCRSFPFFPYINRHSDFLGLSYYWEYEGVCWVISNLQVVSPVYREEFIETYETLFELYPDEIETFAYHSEVMRETFSSKRRAIPLLHRGGGVYKVAPNNERMRRVRAAELPKFGPYKIAQRLPFPEEE